MARRRLTADEVETAAELAGVPPELALATWQQETTSGRNVKTSPKGARGDFQVMPATFRRYLPDGDINDPVDNMTAALAVLADGLRRSKGDPEGAAQFYYHGRLLPPGVEGPTSGPGTPTTREYGRQILAKMRGLGWKGRNVEFDDELPEEANPFHNSPYLKRPLHVKPPPEFDRMLKPYNVDEFGIGTYDFDSDPEETARMQMGEEDEDEAEDQLLPLMPGMQRAGLTGPLALSMNTPGIGGMGDMALARRGQENYDLDRYVRRIVDEEFKRA